MIGEEVVRTGRLANGGRPVSDAEDQMVIGVFGGVNSDESEGYFAGVRSTLRYSTRFQMSSFVSLLLNPGMSCACPFHTL